jgi:hypothetical protein
MLEKNNKCEGKGSEQDQPENAGKQTSHGRKLAAIPKPRRNDEPEGMV